MSPEGRVASDTLQAIEDGDVAAFNVARNQQVVSFLVADVRFKCGTEKHVFFDRQNSLFLCPAGCRGCAPNEHA
jgi:hypothetical protein